MVWEPLIRSKFSVYADAVNAVWFWRSLSCAAAPRREGREQLAYFKGGFGALAQEITEAILRAGGEIRYGTPVTGIQRDPNTVEALTTSRGEVHARRFVFTPAFPIVADIFDGQADAGWVAQLRRVRYLRNVCLVLQLDRSLSDTYWLIVNDPGSRSSESSTTRTSIPQQLPRQAHRLRISISRDRGSGLFVQ